MNYRARQRQTERRRVCHKTHIMSARAYEPCPPPACRQAQPCITPPRLPSHRLPVVQMFMKF